MVKILTLDELTKMLHSPMVAEATAFVSGNSDACLVVDLDASAHSSHAADAIDEIDSAVVQPPCPVVGISKTKDKPPHVVDVVVRSDAQLETICTAIQRSPIAAATLVDLLRHNEVANVHDGLFAESLAYSSLQHGAQFQTWLDGRTPTSMDEPHAVLTERSHAELTITLNRPRKHNAFSASVRDGLCEALFVAIADPTIERVNLRGAGASFCAGGDLDEFGLATDAALAHAVRMTRSAGALINKLRDRVTVVVQGACIGAGIELPAFAGRIVAHPESFFQLPEVAMGLIPGAGGTVSLVKRIGRERTAYLALSNQRIDASTALQWGLVDQLQNSN